MLQSTHKLVIACLLLIFAQSLSGQNQSIADSLKVAIKNKKLSVSERLEALRNISFHEVQNLELAIDYANQLIALAESQGNSRYCYRGYLQKGNKQRSLGDLDEALKSYLSAIECAKKINYVTGIGTCYSSIADIYTLLENHQNAIHYYHMAIDLIKTDADTITLASVILNTGDEYLTYGAYDSALHYFEQAKLLFELSRYPTGVAYAKGNAGMALAYLGNHEQAEQNIEEAIIILQASSDYYPICFYLLAMADIYGDKEDYASAIKYAKKSLSLALETKLKQQISDAHEKLSHFTEQSGDPVLALAHYRSFIQYRDSVTNLATVQNIADLRTDYEVSLREKEIDLLEKDRMLNRAYIATAVVLLILSLVVLLYFRQRFETEKIISQAERKQHDHRIKDLLNQQESKALHAMISGQENERKRIAEELHNHFGSLLATIKVNINGIPEHAISNHQTLTQLVDKACTDIRSLSHALNMGISDNFGLIPALKELSTHLEQSGDVEVEFSASMGDEALDSSSEITIYRIIQELVSNILKHAGASNIAISLTCYTDEQIMNIMVQDDGKGFDLDAVTQHANGMGLTSLMSMVADRGGDIQFDSHPSSGTTVTIDLPIQLTTNLL
ncbi:sensor histidine kinase [Marinoscillum furvescens]|uniref:histidine kinase n=1 Tax=Marinoscillum furvescens DSM 4134 TaxID=1122208 RepID=A0A3D9KYZ2_MARFU|nr:tetratricopeptide repeat protein [Marinoscillum furvescens]RED95262.1 signal transduction histidine kinase [Marinoscillum furvescens DSM 4134]